jgi:hypothetical protein
MIHALRESNALITNAHPQFHPSLLPLLPFWLVLQQRANALRLRHRLCHLT